MHKAFTLLELLLVIAIIAVLAGLILFNLNPGARLLEANEAKAISNANDIEKAIRTYTIEHAGNFPVGIQSLTESGAYNICKQGESIGCVNLDELVTGNYISSIPEDPNYGSTHTIGHRLVYVDENKSVTVYSYQEYLASLGNCPPGDTCIAPVGEWLFDSTSGTSIFDTSGNNITGTLASGAAIEAGKIGNAASFDNSANAYIDMNDSDILDLASGEDLTLSFWVYNRTANLQNLIAKKIGNGPGNGGYIINIGSGGGLNFYNADGVDQFYRASNGSLELNRWYHVAFTYDHTSNSNSIFYINGKHSAHSSGGTTGNVADVGDVGNGLDFVLGAESDKQWNHEGMLDEVRVYKTLRTPTQIAWEYNYGLPIGYWKFDEGSGTSVADSSEYGNSGTINSATWTTGKYSNGLNFNGSAFVDFGNIHDQTIYDFSVSAWIKTSNTGRQAIITKGMPASGAAIGWSVFKESDGQLRMYINDGSLLGYSFPSDLDDNSWHHVAVTFDRNANAVGYVDGVKVGETSIAARTGSLGNGNSLFIGRFQTDPADRFNGQMDEVRVYSYALTPTQVRFAMHENR